MSETEVAVVSETMVIVVSETEVAIVSDTEVAVVLKKKKKKAIAVLECQKQRWL